MIVFFEAANEAVMSIVRVLMWAAPVGVGALIAGRLGAAGGFAQLGPQLSQLSAYILTVVAALSIHSILVLPAFLCWFTHADRHAFRFFKTMLPAITTAFATASSSASLPVTMRCAQSVGISQRTGSFVLPLGATVNMNGTALYEAIAAIFIAQSYGVALTANDLIVIALTSMLAAVGAAGIPEAGLVTMLVVLRSVNLPLEAISLLLSVDWLLDRLRTAVNVWGDAVGAAVVDRFEPADIAL